MKTFKRLISIVLAVGMISSATPITYAATKVFTLKQAIYQTQENFGDTRLKRIELAEKRIALTEAIAEVRDTRKEQRTIRFSLLFNLKFPEKTTLNKEQELISMVPSVENEIRVIKKEIIDLDVEAEYQAVTQYTKLYCSEQQLILEQGKYDQLKEDVEKTTVRAATGLADAEDLTTLRTEFDKQSTVLANQRSRVITEREELGQMTNMNLDGYTLENPLVEGVMPRENLEQAISYMFARDVDIFSAKADVEYTSYCVRLLDDLYTQRWGNKVDEIRPYLYQENVKPDFLLDKYEQLLAKIDQPWDGVFKIFLIFFVIRIPKVWLKGSRDGQRYFSDGKYPLLAAVYDRDSATEEYKQLVEEKRKMLISSYENMIQANKAYKDACDEREINRQDYEKVMRLNKTGAASQGEVTTARDGYMLAQQTELETLKNYNTMLALFNRQTCGYLSGQVSKEVSFEMVGAGDSYKQEDGTLVGKYYISDVISGVTTAFGIELAGKFDATDYELWYGQEKRIGERIAVSSETVHVSSAFKGDEPLLLYLYNDDVLVGKAEINQQVSSGELRIQPLTAAETESTGEKLGKFTFTRQETDIISEIMIYPENMPEVKSFNLSDKSGIMLLDGQPVPIAEPFIYATVGLVNPNELILYLYDSSGTVVVQADMDNVSGNFYRRGEQQ